MAPSVASRIFSGGPNKTAGSTLPCNAIFGPSVCRISAKSMRQSTLSTFAQESATAGGETLDRGKSFLGFAFHHVAGKCPRSTRKTQNGNVRTDGFHNAPNGFGQEARFRLRVEHLEPVDIRFGAHGIGQVWPGVAELQLQAHRFGWDQNVRADDHRINATPAKGLDRDFDRELRRLANLKGCMLCADFAVFRKIPARLAHHPDGNSRKNLAATGAKE